VRVYSGVDGTPLHTWEGESVDQVEFGRNIAAIQDTNGDNVSEVAVTAPGMDLGKVYLYDGATGLLLWSRQNASPERNGSAVVSVGDVNGDGRGDIAYSVGYFPGGTGMPGVGKLLILSGLDGSELSSLEGTANRTLGRVHSLGEDRDGDGLFELVLNGSMPGFSSFVEIVSPTDLATPLLQWTSAPGSPTNVWPGGQDVTGDGILDVLVVMHESGVASIRFLSGLDLQLRGGIPGLTTSFGGVTSVNVGACSMIGDVNGDGLGDVLHGLLAYPTNQHTGIARLFTGGERLGVDSCFSATQNSTGAVAELSAIGSNVVSDDWLSLRTDGLPDQQFGFYLASRTEGFVAFAGGSQGHLCLGGQIGRFNAPHEIRNWGVAGFTTLDVGTASMPQPMGPIALVAGDTWSFQFWYRDQGGQSNFSNVARVDWE